MFIHMFVLNDSQNIIHQTSRVVSIIIIEINKSSNILQFQSMIKLLKFQMLKTNTWKKNLIYCIYWFYNLTGIVTLANRKLESLKLMQIHLHT